VSTVAGFSGHGVCLAPGLAPEVAREIEGEPAGLRMDLYRPDRFERGTGQTETVWGGRHDAGPWRTAARRRDG
jgi:hypothetical protein